LPIMYCITLGHLIYEMCTKKVADTLLPESAEDLTEILDPELADVVLFIFQTAKESGNQTRLIEKVTISYIFALFGDHIIVSARYHTTGFL